MKQFSFICILMLAMATTADAACYADYKAKKDNPLRLHYGVAEVNGTCSVSSAEDQLRRSLRSDGWQLLNVLGVFDDAGLRGRRAEAGEFYLRY